MKEKNLIYNDNKWGKPPGRREARKTAFTLILTVFICLSPLYGADTQRAPINVNLIIDCSSSLSAVKDEISVWVTSRLDTILVEGDNVMVWSAGPSAGVIYSGRINSSADMDAVKSSIRRLSGSGDTTDFSGALSEAASRQSANFTYTLLISASSTALSSILTSPQANLLRFSRIEEHSSWRVFVVGLNIETRVSRAAAAFYGR